LADENLTRELGDIVMRVEPASAEHEPPNPTLVTGSSIRRNLGQGSDIRPR